MVLVYGGTFNPPTKAHFEIVEQLKLTFKPEKIIIVPVGNSYTWKQGLVSFKHRFTMLQNMFENDEAILISDAEDKPDFKGTYALLEELSKTYQEIYFVLGTDNLINLDKWINYEKLLKEFGFVVISRRKYLADYTIFERFQTPYYKFYFDSDISSSRIRREFHKYKTDLKEEVLNYIEKEKLYQGENL
ncbi:nicotinate (nicotinamide) nucleotide adenylyltransferase [Acholeplasma equirhinis]|uniref:nicotinate (nicotinamide) nucleotide adenylyltransferase n=1 Tax=Acholeplasma equirhinis TaxID=555393 RepID=UPI00197ADB21|nr:nicotinate (nicotinamide) nucleotide adenylyltransferase [Acholeplasma equirhinis]MBN3490301.1 nicotinate (nicotinamide) nucleotide adenylyltransferase [Acholeplasma equirhinis]